MAIYSKLVEEGDLVMLGGGYHPDFDTPYRNEMRFLETYTKNFAEFVQELFKRVA